MVNATGGKLFFNRNDVDVEIKTSEEFGSKYYTLTYQPQEGDLNGKFRHIRVSLRDPNLRVIAKAGYYAPDKAAPADPQYQNRINLSEAARSTIPFDALDMRIVDMVRYPDTDSVGISVFLKSRNVSWQNQGDGTSTAQFMVLATSLNNRRDILASRLQSLTATSPTQDPEKRAHLTSHIPIVVRFPRKAQHVRVVVEIADTGRMGAFEIDRKTLDAAPESATPEPVLVPRPSAPDQTTHPSNPEGNPPSTPKQ